MIKTKEIFELLSRGGFISEDSVRDDVRRLYDYIEENYEEYKAYYQGIGFVLEQGNGYFHFSREESRSELTRRLTSLGVWIDRLDFVKTFHSGFSTGVRFTPSAITEAISADVELKEKARKLYAAPHSAKETVEALLDDLVKAGFIELENEFEQVYKVTSAFHFLEGLVEMLTISEEEAADETAQ